MSNTENLTAILDLGRDTLSEGQYLQLANFLKTINKPDAPKIHRIVENAINHKVKFSTYRSAHVGSYTIKMINMTTTCYEGHTPNLYTLKYQVNDAEPVTKTVSEFEGYVRQLTRRFGMKDITIVSDPVLPDEFYSTYAEFKKHVISLELENDKATHLATFGDLDDFDHDPACEEWVYSVLFGYLRC